MIHIFSLISSEENKMSRFLAEESAKVAVASKRDRHGNENGCGSDHDLLTWHVCSGQSSPVE
jgi:hypothetical protein